MIGFRCPFLRGRQALLGVMTGAVLALVPSGVALAHDHGEHHGGEHHRGALFVSPGGTSGSKDTSCSTAAYSSVQTAVSNAPSGGTVVVCDGTYTGNVVISKPLKLLGVDGATIHGSSTPQMACDQFDASFHPVPGGPCFAAITITSSSVKVKGLTVTGAIGEGILATGSFKGGSIGDINISDNQVVNNDLGGIPPVPQGTPSYWECEPVGQVPGDCGEGIHLMAVYDSVVRENRVTGNSGGVLLTDEFGPTHHNLVEHNVIKDNLFDCGVTVPGHNPMALDKNGNRQPNMAGDYDNVIAGNWITGNGVKGEGAGVLFANAAPGSASYDNLVVGNYIAGNELAGVTLHAHPIPPGTFEDLNGNRIIKNTIGTNNTGGDPDAGVTQTTGVLVLGAVPVTVTIAHNRIFDNHFGIWLGLNGNVTAKIKRNHFHDVDVPVFNQL